MGFKEGDSIRCRHHGLLLGPDGCASEMPVKSERVPKAVCAQSYPVFERHRFVWVWIGDPGRTDPALVPNFWPCNAAGWTFDGSYIHIACDYRLGIDNLMDLRNETWVHQGSIGQHEITGSPIDTVVDGDRVQVRRWMPGIEPPPFWRDALGAGGPVDRWQVCYFLPPSSVLIDVGVSPSSAGNAIESYASGVRGFVIDAITPETGATTHYFRGMARNFDIDDAGFTARFEARQGRVFDEDIEVLEVQQRSIAANPDLKLRGYSIDQGSVRARQIIARLARAEEPGLAG